MVGTNFGFPELRPGPREAEQMAVMLVPETAMD
jgi:hypothetical protein